MAQNDVMTAVLNSTSHADASDRNTINPQSNIPPQLHFELACTRPDFGYATVHVPASIVDIFFHEAARTQQHSVQTQGFHAGMVPLEYIKGNFTENLIEHVKELLFKYCVVNYLYEQIRLQKLVVVGEPRLSDIVLAPGSDAQFIFELSMFPELNIYDWKFFPFKAPKRKNYKDLDRQVESFLEEERVALQSLKHTGLDIGDWAGFNLSFTNGQNEAFLPHNTQPFWFKLGTDEIENSLRDIFIGKKEGDIFFSNHEVLQHYFSDQLDTNYQFKIEITGALSHQFFCLDFFKKTFKIKTNKEMHRKLIEVFSYRQDISQRHSMVEESLRALLSKHQYSVPNYLIIRQEKVLIDRIRYNPDYHVYRAEKDFKQHVRSLAEKQVIETILVDTLAYHENITLSDEDIKGYLNLINRPRMKEFIYFDIPSFKIQGQHTLIASEELKRTCLREKTINYIIYHLTKK